MDKNQYLKSIQDEHGSFPWDRYCSQGILVVRIPNHESEKKCWQCKEVARFFCALCGDCPLCSLRCLRANMLSHFRNYARDHSDCDEFRESYEGGQSVSMIPLVEFFLFFFLLLLLTFCQFPFQIQLILAQEASCVALELPLASSSRATLSLPPLFVPVGDTRLLPVHLIPLDRILGSGPNDNSRHPWAVWIKNVLTLKIQPNG